MVTVKTAHQISQQRKKTVEQRKAINRKDFEFKGIFHQDHFPATIGMFAAIVAFGGLSLRLALLPFEPISASQPLLAVVEEQTSSQKASSKAVGSCEVGVKSLVASGSCIDAGYIQALVECWDGHRETIYDSRPVEATVCSGLDYYAQMAEQVCVGRLSESCSNQVTVDLVAPNGGEKVFLRQVDYPIRWRINIADDNLYQGPFRTELFVHAINEQSDKAEKRLLASLSTGLGESSYSWTVAGDFDPLDEYQIEIVVHYVEPFSGEQVSVSDTSNGRFEMAVDEFDLNFDGKRDELDLELFLAEYAIKSPRINYYQKDDQAGEAVINVLDYNVFKREMEGE